MTGIEHLIIGAQQELREARTRITELEAQIAAKDAALQNILQPFDDLIVHAGNMVRWADVENAIDEAHRRFAVLDKDKWMTPPRNPNNPSPGSRWLDVVNGHTHQLQDDGTWKDLGVL